MGIALRRGMDQVLDIIERAEDFEREYPDQREFVRKFIALVRQIARDFSPPQRETLLADARRTFERQAKIVQGTARALEALERLKRQQKQVLDTLGELALRRPPNVTLH